MTVDAAFVSEFMSYDPDTGELVSKKTGIPFRCVNPAGYLRVQIRGRFYQGHRLAWLLAYGEWPAEFLDHKNGNRVDNRLANLRLASKSENNRNRAVQKNNQAGIKGVHFCRQTGRWRAMLMVSKRRLCLGRFDTQEAAANAYREAAERLHGEFARSVNGCGGASL